MDVSALSRVLDLSSTDAAEFRAWKLQEWTEVVSMVDTLLRTPSDDPMEIERRRPCLRKRLRARSVDERTTLPNSALIVQWRLSILWNMWTRRNALQTETPTASCQRKQHSHTRERTTSTAKRLCLNHHGTKHWSVHVERLVAVVCQSKTFSALLLWQSMAAALNEFIVDSGDEANEANSSEL